MSPLLRETPGFNGVLRCAQCQCCCAVRFGWSPVDALPTCLLSNGSPVRSRDGSLENQHVEGRAATTGTVYFRECCSGSCPAGVRLASSPFHRSDSTAATITPPSADVITTAAS